MPGVTGPMRGGRLEDSRASEWVHRVWVFRFNCMPPYCMTPYDRLLLPMAELHCQDCQSHCLEGFGVMMLSKMQACSG
jgi:hypothetical protein